MRVSIWWPHCFISSGFSFRSMGQKKHPAGVVRYLFRRVSWLCSYQKRGSDCRLVRLLRIVSGHISVGRQGTCFGLCAGTPARQCRRLVQRSRRTSGIGRKRCRQRAVGGGVSPCLPATALSVFLLSPRCSGFVALWY